MFWKVFSIIFNYILKAIKRDTWKKEKKNPSIYELIYDEKSHSMNASA